MCAVLRKQVLPGKRVCGKLKFGATLLLLLACCVGALWSQQKREQSVSANTMLVIADIHFNPMFDPSLVAQLEAAEPEQWESTLRRSKLTAFSQYGQDTNWWLLESSLDQMQKIVPRPALIMVEGDSLAHWFPQTYQKITHDPDREHYRKFVLKTMKFLGLELRQRFPHTTILVTPGNNDEECGDYSVEAGGRFLHDTAELVRDLAHGDDEVRASWEALGSFDVPHPTLRGIQIISLNTVFFSNKYHPAKFSEGCAATVSDGPEQAFTWLESRLKKAKTAHQKVWIMFHIPPGIDSYSTVQKYRALIKSVSEKSANPQVCLSGVVPMWVPSSTAQFDSLLERYRGTVIAGFAGHTHVDDFRLLNSGRDAPFTLITPAISPIYNQNPSFRTVVFAKDGSILDQSVYYLTNLIYASSTTPGEWQREYQFSKQWKLARINTATLESLAQRVRGNEAARAEWLKLYNVSSSAAYLTPGSAPELYCAVDELDPERYSRCYCPAQSVRALAGNP